MSPPQDADRMGHHISLRYLANDPELRGEVERILKLNPKLEKAGPNISSSFVSSVKL